MSACPSRVPSPTPLALVLLSLCYRTAEFDRFCYLAAKLFQWLCNVLALVSQGYLWFNNVLRLFPELSSIAATWFIVLFRCIIPPFLKILIKKKTLCFINFSHFFFRWNTMFNYNKPLRFFLVRNVTLSTEQFLSQIRGCSMHHIATTGGHGVSQQRSETLGKSSQV